MENKISKYFSQKIVAKINPNNLLGFKINFLRIGSVMQSHEKIRKPLTRIMRVDGRTFEKEMSVLGEYKKKRRGYVMQDVPRGFTSACRRACLSVAVGCLFAKSPLYHFNAAIGYDNYGTIHILDTHENSINGRARSRMRDNGRRSQTNQNFLRDARYLQVRARERGKIPITAS